MAQPIWNTIASNIVGFVSGSVLEFQFSASAVPPASTITYSLVSGSLPNGVIINEDGLMFGLTEPVFENQSFVFVVRATDNLGSIRDKTFTLLLSGIDAPSFTTPAGTILVTNDSLWIEEAIEYSLPLQNTNVLIALVQGELPPGLEINETGLIRGYPQPPIVNVNLGSVSTAAIATINNTIVSYSTLGFRSGRPIVFTNTVIGGVTAGQTYFVKDVIDSTTFTISTTVGGPTFQLINQAGYMDVSLPNVSVGQPTIQTYEFTLRLVSDFGTALQTYSITVVNQNAPVSIGGPGKPPNSRTPSILNTRPLTYDIRYDNLDYSFYLFPPNSNGITYLPSQFAYIGKLNSDNEFAFQILGKDFDDGELEYVFADLPLGLVGNSVTGWITGNPVISPNSISPFSFSVAVRKVANPGIISTFFNFSFRVTNGIDGEIIWLTSNDLGTVFNGTTSVLAVRAESDVDLEFTLVDGTLPPNLTLLSTGELAGVISFQPNDTITYPNESTDFTFTVRAYSPNFPIVTSEQVFTITVVQLFAYPTDTLYIKCTPSLADRQLLGTLLDSSSLIPSEYIYRPTDPNFGKSTSVIYEHAYGIRSSDFEEYIAAVTINHYWRQLTLGEIKTAVARDDQTGEIIYEVVYSSVIDNLVNPQGESVSKEILWPYFIPLDLGPWYTSETDIFTSYIGDGSPPPEFYTSLTPGFANIFYPNSLPNMREQVGDVLGQEFNTNLLPLWMTSQQANGSTLGYTPAWVICYTKPGFAETIKNNIQNDWKNPVGQIQTLNQINFKIDRFTVNKSSTYNYDNNLSPPAWTGLPSGSPVPSPLDSKDFYVLFPRPTILPNSTQYPR
jgi:hypothetical protein